MASNASLKEDQQKYYAVQKIIGIHIDSECNSYYQVQWEPTWEDADNLIGCEHLIREFWLRCGGGLFRNAADIKQEPVDNLPIERHHDITNNERVSINTQTISTLPNLKRKSRMSLSTVNASSLKRTVSENSTRAMKTSSTVSRLQRNLNRYISPGSRILKKAKGFGCRSPLQYDGGPFLGTKTKQEIEGDPPQNTTNVSWKSLDTSEHRTTSVTRPIQHSDIPKCSQTKATDGSHQEDISLLIERTGETILNNSPSTSFQSYDEEEDNDERDDESDTQDGNSTSSAFENYLKIFQEDVEVSKSKVERMKSDNGQQHHREGEVKRGGEQSVVKGDSKPFHASKLYFKCHMCKHTFTKKDELKKHLTQKHGLEKKSLKFGYPCGQCNKMFKVKSHLVSHLLNHIKVCTKPYKCTMCSMSYASMHELENHHFSHEYPQAKAKSKMRIGDLYEMSNRAKSESLAILQCSVCKHAFGSKRALAIHCRRMKHMSGMREKPMAIKSIQNNQLRDSSYSIRRSFEPTPVSQATKIKAKYKNQKKKKVISTKVKRMGFNHKDFLKCPYCPSVYNNLNRTALSTLNMHLEAKHAEKACEVDSGIDGLTKCPFCTRLFISRKALENHVRVNHKGKKIEGNPYEGKAFRTTSSAGDDVPVNKKKRSRVINRIRDTEQFNSPLLKASTTVSARSSSPSTLHNKLHKKHVNKSDSTKRSALTASENESDELSAIPRKRGRPFGSTAKYKKRTTENNKNRVSTHLNKAPKNRLFECKQCGKSCANYTILSNHKLRKHSIVSS